MEPDDIIREVKSLSRTRRICTYYRVDLHIHSPESSDYCGDSQISSYDFISNFASRGFDLIAITDHNTGAYIDQAIAARNHLAESEGKNIAVLPGVELSVSPGVHLLAILPHGGSKAISDLLYSLQFPIQHHGDSTKLIDKPIGDITRAVHERNGLLIGAHCNSTNGVVEELSGETRIEWLDTLDALEINSGVNSEKTSHTINYVTNKLNIATAFTFGSDSHDAASSNAGMWVKMAEPSLGKL